LKARQEESPLIISVDELLKKKIGAGCTVIDARQRKNFEKRHIPGAVNVDLYIYHWADSSPEGLGAFADQLTKLFVWAGVREERPVIFYDNTSGMYAARGVWLLRYLGHKNASMLDGGLRAWQRRGLKTESGTVPLYAGRFSPSVREDVMASKDYIMKRLHDPSSVQLLDTRERKEWTGELVRGARGGHIPGALNKDWRRNLGRDGRFKDLERLRAMYADLGLDVEKEVITYCQGGYRAANSFVVLSMLGYRVRTYLGSWNEWSNNPGAPVER
jgi:thiosulfate/3-mercaptopyruvate sulfurtransferase